MGSKVDSKVTGGAAGADLNTDSVSEGFTPPSSGAGVATVGPGGHKADAFKLGRRQEAPDAGMAPDPAGSRIRWVRDQAPSKNNAEPHQMDPYEVLAGFVRAGDARADMLARGAVEAGAATQVASADRAGEPSMAELWPDGKDVHEVLSGFANKANGRIEDISSSKGPGRKS